MAKNIMIQGTMSGVGKSLIAAGFCRIFAQDGYRTAPFKSQNMALNSYITKSGLEIGRAQAMQAEAAGTEPAADMNPILLKPTSEMGSQVIVNGRAVGNMAAKDYFEYKKKLIPRILEAYGRLDDEYDIIVIEGAGSPAEINLRENDIVNMGLAKMLDAPVLLVGDIDRGGVFAQLYGTAALLEEEERGRVKGLVINKFRGDASILAPGLKMLEDRCEKKVLGVVPYLNVDIDDEDSLSERLEKGSAEGVVDIAVMRLPRISNFTDFNIFESLDGASLRYVKNVSEFKNPDMAIIPGTKNTIDDLLWLRKTGLEAKLKKANKDGCVIFGICGGYQMLGAAISDMRGAERKGFVRGLEMFDMDTEFDDEKTTARVEGNFEDIEGIFSGLSGLRAEGYEIHMGRTKMREKSPGAVFPKKLLNIKRSDLKGNGGGCDGGAYDAERQIYGSYVHGLFDDEKIAGAIIKGLAKKKGADVLLTDDFDYKKHKDTQYNIIADALRQSLDIEEIYKCMGI